MTVIGTDLSLGGRGALGFFERFAVFRICGFKGSVYNTVAFRSCRVLSEAIGLFHIIVARSDS